MENFLPPMNPAAACSALISWYDQNARQLPWRYRHGEKPDAYRVWLSEVMLQQTTVATVKSYFEKFTHLWPTVHDLARAPIEDVMQAWAGLGYYSRARNLHACAVQIVRQYQGIFPQDEAALRNLKGVGDYTAAAIRAIAHHLPANVVDGNVERVMSRLHRVETPLPLAKPLLKQIAAAYVPEQRCGDYAQALMDLGATICTPRSPQCARCPLQNFCHAAKTDNPADYPRRVAKKPRPTRYGYAFITTNSAGDLLLERRPDSGLLGGLLSFPTSVWCEENFPALEDAAHWVLLPTTVKHIFTHFALFLKIAVAQAPQTTPSNQLWIPAHKASTAGLPSVMQKVLQAYLSQSDKS